MFEKEPWENEKDPFEFNGFEIPLDDYTVHELEQQIFDPKKIKEIAEQPEVKKTIEDMTDGSAGKLRNVLFYKMANMETGLNQLSQIFKLHQDIATKPIDIMGFIALGMYFTGIVYKKKCVDFFNEEYERQKKFYVKLGSESLKAFFTYICVGICYWESFKEKNLESIVTEQATYWINEK